MTISPAISKIYISSLIPKGAAIIEVGSYDGKDAVELATMCDTMVDCFEPSALGFEKLMALQNEHLRCWKYAVSSYNGRAHLKVAADHQQSNTICKPKEHLRVFKEIKYKDSEPVNVTTLDKWNMEVRNAAPVDLIWCDVNGSEVDFIAGAARTLSITKYIYIEFSKVKLFYTSINRAQIENILPGFETIGAYSEGDNYGNLFMKNKNEELWISQ